MIIKFLERKGIKMSQMTIKISIKLTEIYVKDSIKYTYSTYIIIHVYFIEFIYQIISLSKIINSPI